MLGVNGAVTKFHGEDPRCTARKQVSLQPQSVMISPMRTQKVFPLAIWKCAVDHRGFASSE